MEALELITQAIAKAGYTGKVHIGMDVAASEFYDSKDGHYNLDFKSSEPNAALKVSPDGLADIYRDMCAKYPIVSIEDAFDQDDWPAWSSFLASTDIQVRVFFFILMVYY